MTKYIPLENSPVSKKAIAQKCMHIHKYTNKDGDWQDVHLLIYSENICMCHSLTKVKVSQYKNASYQIYCC